MSGTSKRWRTNRVRIIRSHHHGDLESVIYVLNGARSGQQGLVVNLDITPVEVPELIRWIDDLHK